MAAEPDLLSVLRAAFVAGDPTVAYYLDRVKRRVVRVSNGRTNAEWCSAEEVEDDEDRYLEIPAITVSDDFLFMQAFVDESEDPKLARLLDLKKGATKRFIKGLPQAGPEAEEAWRRFRDERVRERVEEWLAEIG